MPFCVGSFVEIIGQPSPRPPLSGQRVTVLQEYSSLDGRRQKQKLRLLRGNLDLLSKEKRESGQGTTKSDLWGM